MKFKTSLIALLALVMASCGGGSVDSNPVLGKVPGLYHRASELRQEAKEEIKNLNGRDSNYPHKVHKIEQDLKEKQLQLFQEAALDAQNVIGQEVPFEAGMVPAPFEVVNVIITEYNGKGCFTARAIIRATQEFQTVMFPQQAKAPNQVAMVDTYLYYVVMAADNRGVSLGKINPFSTRPALGVSQSNVFLWDPMCDVQAEEMINEEGAPIALNCEMYNMTDFESIKFISAQDYRNLGGL